MTGLGPTGAGSNKPCIDNGTTARCENKNPGVNLDYHRPRIFSAEQRSSFGQSAGDPLDTLATFLSINGLNRHIAKTCLKWNIHPFGVLGPILWEALENPKIVNYRGAGLGKGHVQEGIPWIPIFGKYLPLEGNPLFKQIEDIGYLSKKSLYERKDSLVKPKIVINYIAVSLHAFSVIAEAFGFHIRSKLAVLGWVYHSKKLDSWVSHLENKFDSTFEVNDGIGYWIVNNLSLLRSIYPDRSWKEESVEKMSHDIRNIDRNLIREYKIGSMR